MCHFNENKDITDEYMSHAEAKLSLRGKYSWKFSSKHEGDFKTVLTEALAVMSSSGFMGRVVHFWEHGHRVRQKIVC